MTKRRAEDAKWFQISNYEALSDLTVGEFCIELRNRSFIWTIKEKQPESLVYFASWLSVLQGDTILGKTILPHIKAPQTSSDTYPEHSTRTLGLGIEPVTKELLDSVFFYSRKEQYLIDSNQLNNSDELLCERCNELLQQRLSRKPTDRINLGIFCKPCQAEVTRNRSEAIEPYSPTMKADCSTEIADSTDFLDLKYLLNRNGNLLRIDLETYTDDELLNHLRYQIPKLRKLFNIEEPSVPNRSKAIEKHLQQLIKWAYRYHVIPVLDLRLYQYLPEMYAPELTSKEKFITHEQVLNLVFSENERRDPSWIKTHFNKRYLAPLLDKNVIEQIYSYISSSPSLEPLKMSEFIKRK